MSQRKKPAPREAPLGRDEAVPLTAKELKAANDSACKGRRSGKDVVREPEDNVIGNFKILARIDGLTVLHDVKRLGKGDLGNGLVFWTENGARTFAKRLLETKAAH